MLGVIADKGVTGSVEDFGASSPGVVETLGIDFSLITVPGNGSDFAGGINAPNTLGPHSIDNASRVKKFLVGFIIGAGLSFVGIAAFDSDSVSAAPIVSIGQPALKCPDGETPHNGFLDEDDKRVKICVPNDFPFYQPPKEQKDPSEMNPLEFTFYSASGKRGVLNQLGAVEELLAFGSALLIIPVIILYVKADASSIKALEEHGR